MRGAVLVGCAVFFALGCGDSEVPCGWDGPEGCLPGAETLVLATWDHDTLVSDAQLAVQGQHVLLLTSDELRRIAKDGSSDELVARADTGYRFKHLVADGGQVYFIETNQDDAAIGDIVDVRVRRVESAGTPPTTLLTYSALAFGFAVDADDAVTWFCFDGGSCFLDVLDLAAATRSQVTLGVQLVGTGVALHAGSVDVFSRAPNSLRTVSLTRLDAATGTVIESIALDAPNTMSRTGLDAGPTIVGNTVYFGASLEPNEDRVFSYPVDAPGALTTLPHEPGDGSTWRGKPRVIAGDARQVFFRGFFARNEGSQQRDGWFGVATHEAATANYTAVADLSFLGESALAIDATHLFVTDVQSTCEVRDVPCDMANGYTRQLVRITR